ncbi:MAG: glycosyltransferase [Chloroflexota bacterium]|nr:glycosyltransferase [Chloroflexota bacterium]
MTDLAVSIVSYCTRGLLQRCLHALEHERSSLAMTVTIVDNASTDGSAEMVAREFAWARLIRNERNVGFGAGHNQALRGTTARHLLVLNSDAAPVRGALRLLVDYLDTHPRVAVVGPRLRYTDGSTQPSRRRFPGVATLFLESTQLQRFWPDTAILRRFYVADRSDHEEQEVDWLVGACLAVRARAAAEIGLFDERYFLYSEEIDWCRRFVAAGWAVMYLPAAEVVHQEGASTRQDMAARQRAFQTAKLRYAARWHGPRVARALRYYLLVEYLGRGLEEAIKLRLGSRPAERRARLAIIASSFRHLLRG